MLMSFLKKPYFIFFAAIILVATDASAREFEKRFDETMPGRIMSVSNVLITCDTSDARCADAKDVIAPIYKNDPFQMVNIDADSDGSTFNSSYADLQIPRGAGIVHAELYWGGQYTDNGAPHKFTAPPSPADKDKVLFQAPGKPYVAVQGKVDVDGTGFYQGHADVTSLLAGSGFYAVANAQFTTGKHMFGGWTLVVVIKSQLEPMRRIVLWDGFLKHETGSLNVALKDTLGPRRKESSVEMNIVQYDGDKGNYDAMLIDKNLFVPKNLYPVTDPNAAGDIANSSISKFGKRFEDRKPFYKNTLGYDSDLFQIYRYLDSDESIELEFKTNRDVIHPGVISVQSDIEERFVQTDWGKGANGTSSILMNGENGFSKKSGHMFYDTVPGALHTVQFSYSYDGRQYEVTPVRDNRADTAYYAAWRANNSAVYPVSECLRTKYWLYREVDRTVVSWFGGINRRGAARPECDGNFETNFSITGSASVALSDDAGETTLTGTKARWWGSYTDGHVIRFKDREFKVSGKEIVTTTPTLAHHFYLDATNNRVEYELNSGKAWEFESDFHGRLESKIFDGLVPRGFGRLDINVSQTNSSVARVFFRTGNSIANLQSKAWEGPFNNGDLLGTAVTNNQQFFQYALDTTLTDPVNNTIESELTFNEVSFDLYGIAIPIVDRTRSSWKRVDNEPTTSLRNVEANINFGELEIPTVATTINENRPQVDGQVELGEVDLDTDLERIDANAACSTSGRTLTWFPLLIIGLFWGRRRKRAVS